MSLSSKFNVPINATYASYQTLYISNIAINVLYNKAYVLNKAIFVSLQ